MKPKPQTMKAPDLFIEGEFLTFDKRTGELLNYGHENKQQIPEPEPETPEDPNQITMEF